MSTNSEPSKSVKSGRGKWKLRIPRLPWQKQQSRPATSLPTVRVMLHPKPGLGMDLRLPFCKLFRLFLSLESYFESTSAVRMGIELNHLPFLRMELAPSGTLSLRPSPIRFSDLKFGVIGGSMVIRDRGEMPKWNFTTWKDLWHSIRPFISPVIELQHRYTLFGSVIDRRQREALVEFVESISRQRNAMPGRFQQKRKSLLNLFGQDELPSTDPRDRLESFADTKRRLQKKIEQLLTNPTPSSGSRKHWPGYSRYDDDVSSVDPSNIGRSPQSLSEKAAVAASAVRKGPVPVLGQMRPGKDGRYELTSLGKEKCHQMNDYQTHETNEAVNELLAENSLLVLWRRLVMKFKKEEK